MEDMSGSRHKKETIRRDRREVRLQEQSQRRRPVNYSVKEPKRLKHPKEKQMSELLQSQRENQKDQNQKEEQPNRRRPKNRLKLTQNRWKSQTEH